MISVFMQFFSAGLVVVSVGVMECWAFLRQVEGMLVWGVLALRPPGAVFSRLDALSSLLASEGRFAASGDLRGACNAGGWPVIPRRVGGKGVDRVFRPPVLRAGCVGRWDTVVPGIVGLIGEFFRG